MNKHHTIRHLFSKVSTPLPNKVSRATGVFREATECGFGPTKGSESPFATEARQGGGSSSYQAQKAAARQRKKLEKAVSEAEAQVTQLEAALHLIEDRLATPEGAADTSLYEKYTRIKQQLEAAEEEWMTASEALSES